MVTVVNNTITLVRGDTVEIPVTIRLRNGEEYVPSEGDVIRFALKGSYDDNDPVLIHKVLTNESPIIRLEACETKALVAQKKPYVYDVELTTAHGYVDTFIRGQLTVLGEVC